MKGPSISSFSQTEVDLGMRLFKFLATNGEYVTPDQMGAFLRQSNLGNQRLSPLWEKTIGASRKNFQLADTLYLLRMLAMVQQGKDLDDEVLSSSSFDYVADLSFFPFDSGFDVDSIEDSQPSTPTGSIYLRNQGAGESPLRDASRLQNVQQVADLSISRCISLSNEVTTDSVPTESVTSVMHVGMDDLASQDLMEHPGPTSNLSLIDSTVPPGSSHVNSRHSDTRGSVDLRGQQDEAYESDKQVIPQAGSPVHAAASSVMASNPSVLSFFIEVAKHFQSTLLQTNEVVDKVIDASNPLSGLIVVPPEQIVTLKKRLSEMSKKLIDQLNTLSDQTFTSSLSSCLKGLESLSNALTMLISKEKQVIKATNEIMCYLDGSDNEEEAQAVDSQGTYLRGASTEGSEAEEKCTQDCTELDNGSTHEKLKSSKGTFSSQSENVLSTAASIFPSAATVASSSATYQDGEKLPPVHPPAYFTPLRKKSLLKLVKDTSDVVDRARAVEASYARAQEANRMYKSFSESLSSLLQTETETNTNLEEQQKKLEKKADEKAQLIAKQLEQMKSVFSEQALMFTSIVSAKLSSPSFMDQLNLFTIELADKAVSEVSKVLTEVPKSESLSTELRNVTQTRLAKEPAQGHNFPLEIPETSGNDAGQHRGPQSSYNTFSHKFTNTRAELVAQQTIRSIVRDELRSLKGELIEEIRTMICGVIADGRSVRDQSTCSIARPDAASVPVEAERPQQGGNNVANTPSLPSNDRMKPWTYHFGSNIPSS